MLKKGRVGKMANEIRAAIEKELTAKSAILKKLIKEQMLHNEKIDVTLPGTVVWRGGRHPLNIVLEEIENIFLGLGYTIAEARKLKQIITILKP